MDVIDVSVGLGPGLHLWPGSRGFSLEANRSVIRGDALNERILACDVHCGTHVDAPRHFLADGATVEAIPLGVLLGPAWVVDLNEVEVVTAESLAAKLDGVDTMRVLLRTQNSSLWGAHEEFVASYAALTPAAAEWLVCRGVKLVGIDYLSIERFGCEPEAHRILLGAGVVILEGLNLSMVFPGPWELLCIPLKLVGSEAAPARVVLRQRASND